VDARSCRREKHGANRLATKCELFKSFWEHAQLKIYTPRDTEGGVNSKPNTD